jgi:predicted hydrolase (HD superfamily)
MNSRSGRYCRFYYSNRKDLTIMMTRAEAFELLKKYNKEDFHILHGETVEGVMRYFAEKLGHDPEYWGLVGLLHDIDFEMWPEEHCVKCIELLKDAGIEDAMINSIVSHGWGMTGGTVEPTHEMEKVLFACDELTGLIGAAALMRPSKSVQDMEVKSLKKKFKDKKFAAGCDRDVIKQGAERLGWELDYLFEETILAMRTCEK